MSDALPADRHRALRTMRAIGLSMAGAVTIFAVIALLLHRQSPPPAANGPLMLYVWIAVATSLSAAGMVWWRGNVVPLLDGAGHTDWRGRAQALQTGLVVCWALIEAGALFGVVVYFLEGAGLAGALGVAMMWAALAVTWPRPEWLATHHAARDRTQG